MHIFIFLTYLSCCADFVKFNVQNEADPSVSILKLASRDVQLIFIVDSFFMLCWLHKRSHPKLCWLKPSYYKFNSLKLWYINSSNSTLTMVLATMEVQWEFLFVNWVRMGKIQDHQGKTQAQLDSFAFIFFQETGVVFSWMGRSDWPIEVCCGSSSLWRAPR